MKKKIEKAIFADSPEDLKGDYDRIYFGSEFCEKLIPSLELLKKFHDLSAEKKKGFTFVTPFVTEPGLGRLTVLMDYLNGRGPAEVVFNDWGVFHRARERFKNIDLVAGRLLTKQRRDPRILKILTNEQKIVTRASKNGKTVLLPRKCPPELLEHFRASVVNVPDFQEFLSENNVGRVEVDNLLWDMNIKAGRGMGVSVYTPYGYISTTRMCSRLSGAAGHCGKNCKKYILRWKDGSLPVPFYSIGNTVFYRSRLPSENRLRGLGIDRIIYRKEFHF